MKTIFNLKNKLFQEFTSWKSFSFSEIIFPLILSFSFIINFITTSHWLHHLNSASRFSIPTSDLLFWQYASLFFYLISAILISKFIFKESDRFQISLYLFLLLSLFILIFFLPLSILALSSLSIIIALTVPYLKKYKTIPFIITLILIFFTFAELQSRGLFVNISKLQIYASIIFIQLNIVFTTFRFFQK